MKDKIESEIGNYILYFTSDEKEREQMFQVLKNFMDEVYEEEKNISNEIEKEIKAEDKAKPLNAQEVKDKVLPFIAKHCNSDGEIDTSTLEKNFTNKEINLMSETGYIYEPVIGKVKAT